MPFFPSIALSSVSPTVVPDDGGHEIQLSGQFVEGDIEVFIVDGSGAEIPCYSGISGKGYAGPADDPTTITVVTPPLRPGGSYTIRARQGAITDDLANALDVENRSFSQKTMALRSVFPASLDVGPRNLLDANPLHTQFVSIP